MSSDSHDPATIEEATADAQGARRPVEPEPTEVPPLDERRLTFGELNRYRRLLDADELQSMLNDGRAVVRANAARALAVIDAPSASLIALLRDSDHKVANAAAQAVKHLERAVAPYMPRVVAAVEHVAEDIAEQIRDLLTHLVGRVDDDLIAALDCRLDLAEASILCACAEADEAGAELLLRAARHERTQVRLNAVHGLERAGNAAPEATLELLQTLQESDPSPDVRRVAKKVALAINAVSRERVDDSLPEDIEDFEERRLSVAELREYRDDIQIDQMLTALRDGRQHVRINGARALGVLGPSATRASRPLALLLRDSVDRVRRETALALGKLKEGALPAADALVAALGDREDEVAEAVLETAGGLGASIVDALIRGLETGDKAHGERVVTLICRFPDAADRLRAAFASPAVNVQVNAARGLAMLGPERIDADSLRALEEARTGGDARTRDAVREALEVLVSKDQGPPPIEIPGFEDRYLPAEAFAGAELSPELAIDSLLAALHDGRAAVRANGATGLMTLGADAEGAASRVAVLLRDDARTVRLAATHALDKLGDGAVAEADSLVGALGDEDSEVADAVAAVLAARGMRVLRALIAGLETDDPVHARRILALILAFDDAEEILCDGFDSPAVNVQVNAALGLGMLGEQRITAEGRGALENARTGGDARTREAVRTALAMLEPDDTGPPPIEIPGFEDTLLEPQAFAGIELSQDSLTLALRDGRDVVRANAATAVATLGTGADAMVQPVSIRLRDDAEIVRLAAARACSHFGKKAARSIADSLVTALGDDSQAVADAVAEAVRKCGARMLGALTRGLETGQRVHAERILALIIPFEDAEEILCDVFESPAVNAQVNAALGLGLLGDARVSRGRRLLENARTGGDVRTREAVREALDMLRPEYDGPRPITVTGFEDQFLAPEAFAGAELAIDSLALAMSDGRDVVRANAATATGVLGAEGASLCRPLAVLLRDDSTNVRLAAVRAIGKMGDAARELADAVVAALGDRDSAVAYDASEVIRARGVRMTSALVRGLATDSEIHADRILTLLIVLDDAPELLCDAFESPAVNVQVNAARGLGMLGPNRVGAGRRLLEGARTGGDARTRAAVRQALSALDG